MSVSLAIVPASGSVKATVSACRITVSGASTNDPDTFDEDTTPTEEALLYRLVASKSGQDDLVSHLFQVSATGHHVWDNLIFPDDGTWSVKLVDQADDSNAATLSVVVTA